MSERDRKETRKLKEQIDYLSGLISRARRQKEISSELAKLRSQICTAKQKPKSTVLSCNKEEKPQTSSALSLSGANKYKKVASVCKAKQKLQHSKPSREIELSWKTIPLVTATEQNVGIPPCLSAHKSQHCVKELKLNQLPAQIARENSQSRCVTENKSSSLHSDEEKNLKKNIDHQSCPLFLSKEPLNVSGTEKSNIKLQNSSVAEVKGHSESPDSSDSQIKIVQCHQGTNGASPSKADSLRAKYSFMRKNLTSNTERSDPMTKVMPQSGKLNHVVVAQKRNNCVHKEVPVNKWENEKSELLNGIAHTKSLKSENHLFQNSSSASGKKNQQIKLDKYMKLKLELLNAEAKIQSLKQSLSNSGATKMNLKSSTILPPTVRDLGTNIDQCGDKLSGGPSKLNKNHKNANTALRNFQNSNANFIPSMNKKVEPFAQPFDESMSVNDVESVERSPECLPAKKTDILIKTEGLCDSEKNKNISEVDGELKHLQDTSDDALVLLSEQAKSRSHGEFQKLSVVDSSVRFSAQHDRTYVSTSKNPTNVKFKFNENKTKTCEELNKRIDSLRQRCKLIRTNRIPVRKLSNSEQCEWNRNRNTMCVKGLKIRSVKKKGQSCQALPVCFKTKYKLTRNRQAGHSSDDYSVSATFEQNDGQSVTAIMEETQQPSCPVDKEYRVKNSHGRAMDKLVESKQFAQNTRYRLCKNSSKNNSMSSNNLQLSTFDSSNVKIKSKSACSVHTFIRRKSVDKCIENIKDMSMVRTSRNVHPLRISVSRYKIRKTPAQQLSERVGREQHQDSKETCQTHITSSLVSAANRWNKFHSSQAAAKVVLGKYKLKRLHHRSENRHVYPGKQINSDVMTSKRHQRNSRYKYIKLTDTYMFPSFNNSNHFTSLSYLATDKCLKYALSSYRRQQSIPRKYLHSYVSSRFRRMKFSPNFAFKKYRRWNYGYFSSYFPEKPKINNAEKEYWDNTNFYLQNSKRSLHRRYLNLQKCRFRSLKIDHRQSPNKKCTTHTNPEFETKLVLLNGMLYKSSQKKLEKTKLQQSKEQTSQDSDKISVRQLHTRGMKTVSVRGVRFKVDNNGKTLRRITNSLPRNNTENTFKNGQSLVSRVDIGGVTYIQTKPGTLVQVGSSQKRARANRVISKSIAMASSRHRTKPKQYCMFYNRFGKCNRGDECQYIHDPEKIAVCTRFLRGTCKGTDCLFSHKVDKEKMPACSFFLRGTCNHENCPYLHVKVNKHAEVCQEFLKGFCPLGQKCKKKHTLVCPTFSETGDCPKGKKCRLKHILKNTPVSGTSLQLKRDSKSTSRCLPAVKAIKRKVEKSCTEDDPDIPFKHKKLPVFISLQSESPTNGDNITDVTKDKIESTEADSSLHIVPRL